MDVTIVIPTKNAGNLFDLVLERIFSQKTKYSYEVICVDSGSSDNTIEIIKKYDVTLFMIQPSEFGHGKTRNFGASKGTGDYIIFITQDAVPVNDLWLESFIQAMELFPSAAGGFGIHYPYSDCNFLDKRDIEATFNQFGKENVSFSLSDPQKYSEEASYRHFLAFFSNNNSCLRRRVWENIPFDDVDFSEDQSWAKKIIESGYEKIYCPHCPVFHSHNFKLNTYFSRYYDEYKAIYRVHQYQIASSILDLFKVASILMKQNIDFIIHSNNLESNKKVQQITYSLIRTIQKVRAGYLGGKYHTLNDKTKKKYDKKYSQQYKQINSYEKNLLKRFFNYKKKYGLNATIKRIVIGNTIGQSSQSALSVQDSMSDYHSPKSKHDSNPKKSCVKQEIPATSAHIDLVAQYDFIINKTKIPLNYNDYCSSKKGLITINWIIPEPGIGSGGHQTIFRFVSYLQKQGIENRIYIFKPISIFTDRHFYSFMKEYFPTIDNNVKLIADISNIKFATATFATAWQSAYFVRNFENTLSKFYFVQDYEPYFYPLGSEYQMAENTYKFGFRGITAGSWLKDVCTVQYGMISESFGFSFDKTVYIPIKKEDSIKRVLFYARPYTHRRDFELGLLALNELSKKIPEIDIVFVGADLSAYVIPFPHQSKGILKVPELAYWQSQSDFCLVLSNTNLSLLPLEVMGSNSIAVCSKGDNSTWLVNEDNAILVDYEPSQIADTLFYYFKHPEKMDYIRQKGYEFAQKTSWDTEFERAKNAIISGIEEDKSKILDDCESNKH